MRILLTGSSGFIGSYVLRRLLSENHEIIIPIRIRSKPPEITGNHHPIVIWGDFFEKSLLQKLEEYHPEVIIHLASIRGEGKGSSEIYQRVNVEGTETLSAFALNTGIKMFIYCSSVGVFGTIPRMLPANLKTPLAPDNTYHYSKYQAEQVIVRSLNGKVPYCIIRPTITYGAGDDGFLYKLVQMVRNRKFPVMNTRIKIHLLQVETFAELISQIIRYNNFNNSTLILTDKIPVNLFDIVNTIYQHFYSKPYPGYLRLPHFLSDFVKLVCRFLGMKSLYTSLQLISNSWYYDYGNIIEQYSIELKDTLSEIKKYLQKEFPV